MIDTSSPFPQLFMRCKIPLLSPISSALYETQDTPSEMECDKVVKEAQTKAIAKARGVGMDDICCHFWVVLTLENGTMLHIDAVGKNQNSLFHTSHHNI